MNDIMWAITINIAIAIVVVISTQFLLRKLRGELKDSTPTIDKVFFDLALTCSEYEKTAGGRLSNYFDTDQALMRDPEVLSRVSQFIADILKKYPTEKICFIEKDSGPIGALILSGLVSSTTKRPTSAIRTRRDVQAMSVKGAMIEPGDKVVLIQDVVTTGFQVLLATEKIEKFGAKVVAVISLLDRKEKKSEGLEEKDIMLYSYQTLSLETIAARGNHLAAQA